MGASVAGIRDRLMEGDRREIGAAGTVADMVARETELVRDLLDCLDDENPVIVSHAAHALMQTCERQPQLFDPHVEFLMVRLAEPRQWEIGEQLPKILVKTKLTDGQSDRLVQILEQNLSSKWAIVSACSLQGLVDLALAGRIDRQHVEILLTRALSSGRKALSARARQLQGKFA